MLGDWGRDGPAWSGAWPTTALGPSELPAVVAAGRDGFALAPDAPLWCFLPAVWPPGERVWVEDRAVRSVTVSSGGRASPLPWSRWDVAVDEEDVRQLLEASGVPPRPPGRLWMLRPPPGCAALEDALAALVDEAEATGVPVRCSRPFVLMTAARVRRWFDV